MSNFDNKLKQNTFEESFNSEFPDPKELYIPQQSLLSSQNVSNQSFNYTIPGTNSGAQGPLVQHLPSPIQNITTPSVLQQNMYIYNSGSSNIPPQQLRYPTFNNGLNENEEINTSKTNYQLRKLKKARLKRQKKAEYIDFLEQRISQLDRIIKQNNLIYTPPDQENNQQSTTTTENTAINASALSSEPIPKPMSNPIDDDDDVDNDKNNEKLKRNLIINEENSEFNKSGSVNKKLKFDEESSKMKNNIKEDILNEKNNESPRTMKKGNEYEFENCRLDSSILLQRYSLDSDIVLNLKKDFFDSAEEFFNIPDEISCDFYEIDKQRINFNDDSLDIFYRPNENIPINNIPNEMNLHYDGEDPFGIINGSICSFDAGYKNLSETDNFNYFVVEIIKSLFINCSYFPPDDLIDLNILKKDLNSHNLFLINSLCAYGLSLIPCDIPFNIGNWEQYLKDCRNFYPASSLEEFYYKYMKNNQINNRKIFALSEMFYYESLKYHFFDGPMELHTIEGYISLCLYSFLMGRIYKGWEFLGIAVRYGDALNLNGFVDNNNISFDTIIKKRLWWKCYAYDVMSVKIVSTDSFFNVTRFDKFTCDKINYYNQPDNGSEEIKKENSNSTFLIFHRLVRVWKKMTIYCSENLKKHLNNNYFYSINFSKSGQSLFRKVERKQEQGEGKSMYFLNEDDEFSSINSVLDPQQESLKLEIKGIWDSVPDIFKRVSMINVNMNPNILKLMSSFNLLIYSMIICLYRPNTVHNQFLWNNNLKRNSYGRMVCLQSSQRIARYVYWFIKSGVIDLIPNAAMLPILDAVLVLFDDFRADKNLSAKRSIKHDFIYYEEKRKKKIILDILTIYFYHKAKHQILANFSLKLIMDFCNQYNIPTILQKKKLKKCNI